MSAPTFYDSFKGLVPCEPLARISDSVACTLGVRVTADHAPYEKGETLIIMARHFVNRAPPTKYFLKCSTAPIPEDLPSLSAYDFLKLNQRELKP